MKCVSILRPLSATSRFDRLTFSFCLQLRELILCLSWEKILSSTITLFSWGNVVCFFLLFFLPRFASTNETSWNFSEKMAQPVHTQPCKTNAFKKFIFTQKGPHRNASSLFSPPEKGEGKEIDVIVSFILVNKFTVSGELPFFFFYRRSMWLEQDASSFLQFHVRDYRCIFRRMFAKQRVDSLKFAFLFRNKKIGGAMSGSSAGPTSQPSSIQVQPIPTGPAGGNFLDVYECAKMNKDWSKVSNALKAHPDWLTRVPEGK